MEIEFSLEERDLWLLFLDKENKLFHTEISSASWKLLQCKNQAERTERPNMSHSFYNWERIHSRITAARLPIGRQGSSWA